MLLEVCSRPSTGWGQWQSYHKRDSARFELCGRRLFEQEACKYRDSDTVTSQILGDESARGILHRYATLRTHMSLGSKVATLRH
jgi:hypothetical protein